LADHANASAALTEPADEEIAEPVVAPISSPLNLLAEEEQAREVLLLSFTLNLEFWERYALSVARGLGARVTVVGDATMVEAAPSHVRYAGITYLDGRAVCRNGGAFHPKLLVIAGDDYATVAIGSGNTTLSGWHDNAELWTVLRGDTTGAPTTFAPLAAWLRMLPSDVRFSPRVEQTLTNVAELLERLPATQLGPQLLTTAGTPILEQLPQEASTDELVVASPFFDRRGRALRQLFERLEPSTTRLFLQPRDVVADGGVLTELLGERNGHAETIDSTRYFHGKLVEWSVGGRRFALTGSPNLSWAALGQTLSDGGNCELAVLGEIAATLAPPSGGRIEREQLAGIAFEPRFESPPALILLGVLRAPDRVAVALARPFEEPGVLEHLVGAEWEPAVRVPPHVEDAEFAIVLDAGAAVRVRQGDLVSNVCFVADPSRFTRTRVEHLGRVRTDEHEVFRDPSIAHAFAQDLAELRQFIIQSPTVSGQARNDSHTAGGTVSFTSWEEYLDACEAHLGERLLAYGLALPALGSAEGRLEEGAGGLLDDDSAEDAAGESEEHRGEMDGSQSGTSNSDDGHPAPRFDELTDYQRRRYQLWCERLAALAPQLPYAGRLVALRLILDAVRGELFPHREQWLPLVASATVALGDGDGGFEKERSRAASLAAVALATMRSQLRRYGDYEELRFPYEQAAQAAVSLLTEADPDAIERYAAPLELYFGPAVRPAAVEELVASLLQPDLIAEAVQLAELELGLSAEQHGKLIELNDPISGDPRRTLLSVISLCERANVVAVSTPRWVGNRRALAIWRAPELILLIRNETGVRGALYELRGFGPGTFKDDVQALPRPVAEWTNEANVPARAALLMQDVAVA
jgi:hypothetical protein